MWKKLVHSFKLKNSWNYKENKTLLFLNVLMVSLALYGGILHFIKKGEIRFSPQLSLDMHKIQSIPAFMPVEKFEGQIQKNTNLSDVLTSYNLSPSMIQQLVLVTKPIYNVKSLIVGNRFELEKLPDGTLKTFTYNIDSDQCVRVTLTREGYKAEMRPVGYDTKTELIAGSIKTSLFQSLEGMHEGDQLALELAEIFSYDIDFHSELRPSDSFKLAVEKLYRNGSFVKYGRILAAEFNNKGKVYSAYYFKDSNGIGEYYDAQGRALKRELLKSPIKFSRISSTFSSSRFHPLLKSFRPHMAVDYSAAIGTPVYAAGNGRVQFANWKSGFGKFIEISHNTELNTMYGHLSRFASGIRPGVMVKQGQVIGYVGMTGMATGPHLDYRISRRGRLINPLTIKFQPSAPLKSESVVVFETRREYWEKELAGVNRPPVIQQASLARRARRVH
jgi:murein DD-endopeptidase MepM/ murein hydrolase activator NlpD